MAQYKADLHLHTSMDEKDSIPYSPEQLIDFLAVNGYHIAAMTHHERVFFSPHLEKYAKSKGVLLIPGCEHKINGKEILIYNISENERKKINSFDDLRELRKKKKILVIAPHPFYILPQCLGKKLTENIDVFDAIEHSFFYFSLINLNRKAIEVAEKNKKAIIGTSDAHTLANIGYTYSIIDAEKLNIENIIDAVRQNKTKLKTKPLNLLDFLRIGFRVIKDKFTS